MFGYDWPRLHAALNDLPAALLLVAVVFDLAGALWGRAQLRTAGYWTLMAGALGAAVAVLSGLEAEDHIAHGEAVHRLMETHETLALTTLGIFGVLALWRIVRENRMGEGERLATRLAALAGVGTLVATGVYGGKMVFDHAAGIPTEVLQAEVHERSQGHHHGTEAEPATDPDDHGHGISGIDSSMTAPADLDTGVVHPTSGHSHAPGTPPHKD